MHRFQKKKLETNDLSFQHKKKRKKEREEKKQWSYKKKPTEMKYRQIRKSIEPKAAACQRDDKGGEEEKRLRDQWGGRGGGERGRDTVRD